MIELLYVQLDSMVPEPRTGTVAEPTQRNTFAAVDGFRLTRVGDDLFIEHKDAELLTILPWSRVRYARGRHVDAPAQAKVKKP